MRWGPETRAALVLLGLAAVGTAVRTCGGRGGGAPGAVWAAASDERPARDSMAEASARLTRPLAPGERIDVNRAGAADLARLPRIGPSLAAAIIEHRSRRGGFRSLDALGAVPGVGDATLAGLAPHVSFGATSTTSTRPPGSPVPINRATAEELEALPGIGPVLAAAIVVERTAGGPFRTAADLVRVRGIGPAVVERLKGRILLP